MDKTIIFDLHGNDHGIEAGVRAAQEFVNNFPAYKIVLVGNRAEILGYTPETPRLIIHHAPNPVSKDLTNLAASFKEDNSMTSALHLLKAKQGAAMLSSGDSGKYILAAMMILKRLSNVTRPAFMSIIPTVDPQKKFLLLDEGANLHSASAYLVQWAKLGVIFAQTILKIAKPRVGLINIGTEDYKGFEFHQEANQSLRMTEGDFEYLGFIEPRNLIEGICDVAVADGFTGNIILKTLEGSVLTLTRLIKRSLTKTPGRKVASLLLKRAFGELKEQLDYRNVGAAWILGVDGLVIKAHGSSDQKAYYGALNQIRIALEANALEKLRKTLE